MRLLLDEMFPAVIAAALRESGHDVVAVHEEPSLRRLPDPGRVDEPVSAIHWLKPGS